MSILTPQSFYRRERWRCIHETDTRSGIDVFFSPTQTWLRVATVWATHLVSAKEIAEFLVGVVNNAAATSDLLDDAQATLMQMLADGVDFSSEQEAEQLIAKINKRVA